ncbi:MAG: SUMF1/EgtB/PvdO family nonheme iron enzyme [Planctomycetes bacterium]|nr:SUMF1/EgtB/PvdO family nonheme iron enzyme [Planctomycetota bacterium]
MAVGGDESLFCRIAVDQGYLSQDDIDRCRILQRSSGSAKPLVIHLIEGGLLDDKKLNAIIERVDRAQAEKKTPRSRGALDALRFGEVAVRLGLATQPQIDEALRRQKKEAAKGRSIRIGQILGESGVLSSEQIQKVLSAQNKRVVRCSGCKSKFNIANFDPNRSYQCRKCGFPLDAEESVGTLPAARGVSVQSLSTVEEVGSTLVGREVGEYEIVEMIGEGGMAEVYKVIEPRAKTVRALKLLKSSAESERFRREIKNIRKLEHPNVIRIYEDGTLDGKPYFFMDFVDGEALVERMDRGETSLPESLEILRQIASGLEAAHAQGIIHRDIKPSNILLDSDSEGNFLVKITDFGIARSTTDTQVTMEGELLGTFKYMSPEHIKGVPIDGRSDIFSLGVIAYELLTGREPFEVDAPVGYLFVNIKEEPPPIYAARKDLPRKLDLLVRKLMAKEPKDRYDATGLIRDLEVCRAHLAGKGELETEDPQSVFYVSGGRRLIAGMKNLFKGFGKKRVVVHSGSSVEDDLPVEMLDSESSSLLETEALEFSQEAKLEFEWAMQLLEQGNVSRARQSLKALVEVAGRGSSWGIKAAEKLKEIADRSDTDGMPVPRLDETAAEDEVAQLERELASIESEAAAGESNDGVDLLASSDLGRRLREEDMKTSEMILHDTSAVVHDEERMLDVELAQESLISAKTFIDKVQSLAEYRKQKDRLEAIFRRIAGTRWEREAADELAEILYKWGRFLVTNRAIEEGIDKYWMMVERFPESRWADQVIGVLAEIEKPEGMTLVPAGRARRGSANGACGKGDDAVQLAPFFIDEHPVTNAAYKEFVDSTGREPPRHWKNRVYPLGKGNHPVVYVNWEDAAAYASWRGKRLPTEEEWSRAAAGDELDRLWPWGNQFDENSCNSRSLGIGDTTPVGQFPRGKSPFGCLDMIGNVWEWTGSWYDPEGRQHRVLRGGSWFTYAEFTYISYRNYDLPRSRTRLYGFRSARNFERPRPDPA